MTKAVKHDGAKPRMELLPARALEEMAKVLTFGAGVYGDWNWTNGFKWQRLGGAILRHTYAWLRGEDLDPDSGLHHLAHAGCEVMFALEHALRNLGEDDRHKFAALPAPDLHQKLADGTTIAWYDNADGTHK